MPTYSFVCPDHGRFFTRQDKVPDKAPAAASCETCGRESRRDWEGDLKSVRQIGSTPISRSDAKHSLARELSFAFGKHKTNPDGSVDRSKPPFESTGELEKFMKGQNQMGPPKLDQKTGAPIRRRDGSIVREGAELFKYGPNDTPSKSGVQKGPRRRINAMNIGSGPARPRGAWDASAEYVSKGEIGGVGSRDSVNPNISAVAGARRYNSPRRGRR